MEEKVLKEIIKRNQIVLFTIALMLIVAGYMNYTVNTENVLKTAAITDSEEYAELGDARLVNSNAIVNEELEEETIETSNERNEDKDVEVSNNNTAITEYFTQSRIDRDNMYSQMIESYEKILSNENISETQRNIAENEIININNKKNAVMISENLIKNKGFEDVIIFVNDKSVNAVIRTENLEQEQVAQIQNIIQREMNAEIENIHISNK